MNNLNKETGYQVIGKLVNGVITITATKPNAKGIIIKKAVNYENNNTDKGMNTMRMNRITEQPYITPTITPAIKKVEALDVPDFMKQRSKEMQRIKQINPSKKQGLFRAILEDHLNK